MQATRIVALDMHTAPGENESSFLLEEGMRYEIWGYYSDDAQDTERLSRVFGTPAVLQSNDATVLDWNGSSALWSDGVVTGALLRPKREHGGRLTDGGRRLLAAVGRFGDVEGGTLRLLEIAEAKPDHGVDNVVARSNDGWRYEIEVWRGSWQDGRPTSIYLYSRLNGKDTETKVYFDAKGLMQLAEADGLHPPDLGRVRQALFAATVQVSDR